jgi:hypothetical protein
MSTEGETRLHGGETRLQRVGLYSTECETYVWKGDSSTEGETPLRIISGMGEDD